MLETNVEVFDLALLVQRVVQNLDVRLLVRLNLGHDEFLHVLEFAEHGEDHLVDYRVRILRLQLKLELLEAILLQQTDDLSRVVQIRN